MRERSEEKSRGEEINWTPYGPRENPRYKVRSCCRICGLQDDKEDQSLQDVCRYSSLRVSILYGYEKMCLWSLNPSRQLSKVISCYGFHCLGCINRLLKLHSLLPHAKPGIL
ncbi:E3 ubiquitin-protein ligase MARCH4 [Platysternon megacephalum]|uniref:E3 ubiquitin-protein ligase MARCH4 n=1 Tax=Platysternon megacephalum TaxID=55544 RepID=A0A4D9E353_9SAUR|nr:E3 ubiquitin-protein ligase MARCH4 [Platysternon megacephalum]